MTETRQIDCGIDGGDNNRHQPRDLREECKEVEAMVSDIKFKDTIKKSPQLGSVLSYAEDYSHPGAAYVFHDLAGSRSYCGVSNEKEEVLSKVQHIVLQMGFDCTDKKLRYNSLSKNLSDYINSIYPGNSEQSDAMFDYANRLLTTCSHYRMLNNN